MNYNEIESLKLAISSLARRGCKIRIPSAGINGRIIGVGFKPYWTAPLDSKIDKLEINYIDDGGSLRSYCFHYIVGFDVISNDGRGYDSMKNACIDIHEYQLEKNRSDKQKVRIEIYSEEEK